MTYVPLIKTSMVVLNCRALADGHLYLSVSPSIRCFTGGHIALAVLAGALLIALVVVVPSHLTFRILQLWRSGRLSRARLRHTSTSFASTQPLPSATRQSPTASVATVTHEHDTHLLCAGFKSQFIIFATVDFAKLAVNVAIGVLPLRITSVERMVATMLLLCINWIVCFVNYLRKPLRQSLDNHLRAVTLGCTLMLSGSGLIRFQDSSNSAATDPSPYRFTFITFFLIQPLLLLPWYLMRRWLMTKKTRQTHIRLAMVSTKSIMWPRGHQPPDAATDGKAMAMGAGTRESSQLAGESRNMKSSSRGRVGTDVALNQTLMRAYLLLGDAKDLEADEPADGGTT
ncbi:hypothetical protein BCR44DRAFT_64870 [Catenaria anguillulae PL171]|uniref:TRP C-terminal domain-containing protein n=1 Tax=Catenaria anguillulae PL171 TaxID=765915 RepID=A0A1Y2H785_9FUNG|nr:hypothetical protein BCR44DRAFT_64870 [Catenaria anguillulae PL171]